MPTLMVSLKGKPVSRFPLVQRQTRIGRRSGNDLVLDSWSVSGAHAVLTQDGTSVVIEDLGSRNGTYVQDARVARAELQVGSVVRIADYTLTLVEHKTAMAYEPTMIVRAGAPGSLAQLKSLDGPSAGQLTDLSKVITSVGTPGVCEVTFIRRGDDYAARYSGAGTEARLNGAVLGDVPVRLHNGDIVEFGDDRYRFQVRDVKRPEAPDTQC